MGTRKRRLAGAVWQRDHPHACGDKMRVNGKCCMTKGSSPRVWGQVAPLSALIECAGIIPTRVGTSQKRASHCPTSQDHPHACGDKNVGRKKRRRGVGSSPRVWGQAAAIVKIGTEDGIIPTRVGTSKHPNMRAEVARGSSPRVWGQD